MCPVVGQVRVHKAIRIKIPQARVLSVLMSGAALTRAKISQRAGFTELSGTVTRVLNGLKEGSSSGTAHLGIVALGLVERIELEVEVGAALETVYRITAAGRDALAAFVAEHGEMPDMRSRAGSTNKRYQS